MYSFVIYDLEKFEILWGDRTFSLIQNFTNNDQNCIYVFFEKEEPKNSYV